MDWLEKLLSGNWGGGSNTPVVNPNKVRGGSSMDGTSLTKIGSLIPQVGPKTTGSGGGMFGGLFDNFLGSTDKNGIKTEGWGGTALGLGQGLFQGYNGMKQFGLAEDQFKESQRQYNQDYAAQVKSVNTQLEDRQRARVASNPNAYESVSTYLDKNRMK